VGGGIGSNSDSPGRNGGDQGMSGGGEGLSHNGRDRRRRKQWRRRDRIYASIGGIGDGGIGSVAGLRGGLGEGAAS